jgi:hypothetical protein
MQAEEAAVIVATCPVGRLKDAAAGIGEKRYRHSSICNHDVDDVTMMMTAC